MTCYSPSGHCDQTTCDVHGSCAWPRPDEQMGGYPGHKSDTKEFWSGEFGDQYIKRNRYDWRKRMPFWNGIIARTGSRSVYEVGCNVGYNLSAIKHATNGCDVQLYGDDVNPKALDIAHTAGLTVFQPGQIFIDIFELAFTSGVLIHIGPDDLPAMMKRIVDMSCDYVLAIEYEDETEVEVEYRGHTGKLWRRPYGKMYQDMGLELIETGKLDDKDGFDKNGVTFWLLRKL